MPGTGIYKPDAPWVTTLVKRDGSPKCVSAWTDAGQTSLLAVYAPTQSTPRWTCSKTGVPVMDVPGADPGDESEAGWKSAQAAAARAVIEELEREIAARQAQIEIIRQLERAAGN